MIRAKMGQLNRIASAIYRLKLPWQSPALWNPTCLAPWVHSFVHTSGKRRLCCISSDVDGSEGKTLAEHWNNKAMRRIRRVMLKGELPPECAACKNRFDPLYDYFNHTYGERKPELEKQTSWRGTLKAAPIAFDYRLSNQCNFKCYMCSPNYSSSWEKEALEIRGDYSLPDWHRQPKKKFVENFQQECSEKELSEAIENKTVREIYWAGGEPLLLDAHWRLMKRIIELGIAPQVFVKYNTNFSMLKFKGTHLFEDLLTHFPKFMVGASLDATGELGEYLRTGLQWPTWEGYLQEARKFTDQKNKTIAIAHTLTTLGLLDLRNMLELSRKYGVQILTQLIEVEEPSRFMQPLSPLIFPKEIRNRIIEEALKEIRPLRTPLTETTFLALEDLLQRESWVEHPRSERIIRKSLAYYLKTETHRRAQRAGKGFFDFLSTKPYARDWLLTFTNE